MLGIGRNAVSSCTIMAGAALAFGDQRKREDLGSDFDRRPSPGPDRKRDWHHSTILLVVERAERGLSLLELSMIMISPSRPRGRLANEEQNGASRKRHPPLPLRHRS